MWCTSVRTCDARGHVSTGVKGVWRVLTFVSDMVCVCVRFWKEVGGDSN